MPVSQFDNKTAETYFVGKRDFKSFFVTVCRNGRNAERIEGFATVEQARAWVRERVQATMPPQYQQGQR